jgi:hypothetical protein
MLYQVLQWDVEPVHHQLVWLRMQLASAEQSKRPIKYENFEEDWRTLFSTTVQAFVVGTDPTTLYGLMVYFLRTFGQRDSIGRTRAGSNAFLPIRFPFSPCTFHSNIVAAQLSLSVFASIILSDIFLYIAHDNRSPCHHRKWKLRLVRS